MDVIDTKQDKLEESLKKGFDNVSGDHKDIKGHFDEKIWLLREGLSKIVNMM